MFSFVETIELRGNGTSENRYMVRVFVSGNDVDIPVFILVNVAEIGVRNSRICVDSSNNIFQKDSVQGFHQISVDVLSC